MYVTGAGTTTRSTTTSGATARSRRTRRRPDLRGHVDHDVVAPTSRGARDRSTGADRRRGHGHRHDPGARRGRWHHWPVLRERAKTAPGTYDRVCRAEIYEMKRAICHRLSDQPPKRYRGQRVLGAYKSIHQAPRPRRLLPRAPVRGHHAPSPAPAARWSRRHSSGAARPASSRLMRVGGDAYDDALRKSRPSDVRLSIAAGRDTRRGRLPRSFPRRHRADTR